MKKGILFVSGAILLTGIGIWAYNKFKGGTTTSDSGSSNFDHDANFALLRTNLGANVKPDSRGIIVIMFNNQKNKAQFYDNSRVIIFTKDNAKVASGTFLNGGKTIIIDGKTPITSTSVYDNLNKTI